eukprot:gene30415-39657_t
MQVEQVLEYGHEECKSVNNEIDDDAQAKKADPSQTINKREIISTQKKRSFDRTDSWQADRYKEMVSVNLFDQKLRRPSSFRSQDDDKVESEAKGLVPSISYLFSSFGSSELAIDSEDADWLDLYPISNDVVDEVNPEKPLVQKRRKSQYTKNAEEICKIFNISSASVFDGEMIKKKFASDFLAKDAFVWINLCTKTLHWVKSPAERSSAKTSKYLLIRANKTHQLNTHILGENKGEIKSIMRMPGDSVLIISTKTGDYLELQVSADSLRNWVAVLRRLCAPPMQQEPDLTPSHLRVRRPPPHPTLRTCPPPTSSDASTVTAAAATEIQT